jgi:hypothetical protein
LSGPTQNNLLAGLFGALDLPIQRVYLEAPGCGSIRSQYALEPDELKRIGQKRPQAGALSGRERRRLQRPKTIRPAASPGAAPRALLPGFRRLRRVSTNSAGSCCSFSAAGGRTGPLLF